MFGIGTQELIFIILVVLLFFGGKKIPELMKGLGKGVRSFKEGMNGIETSSVLDEKTESQTSITNEKKAGEADKTAKDGAEK